jgi:hypothetical protein
MRALSIHTLVPKASRSYRSVISPFIHFIPSLQVARWWESMVMMKCSPSSTYYVVLSWLFHQIWWVWVRSLHNCLMTSWILGNRMIIKLNSSSQLDVFDLLLCHVRVCFGIAVLVMVVIWKLLEKIDEWLKLWLKLRLKKK